MVLQVLNVSCVIAIPLTSPEHTESASSHCFHIRPAIREHILVQNLQHAAIICKPGQSHRQQPRHVLTDVSFCNGLVILTFFFIYWDFSEIPHHSWKPITIEKKYTSYLTDKTLLMSQLNKKTTILINVCTYTNTHTYIQLCS